MHVAHLLIYKGMSLCAFCTGYANAKEALREQEKDPLHLSSFLFHEHVI